MTLLSSAVVLAWIALVLIAFALAGLLRRVQSLSDRLEGGASIAGQHRVSEMIGQAAPRLEHRDLDTNRSTLLLFSSTSCDVCKERVAELEQIASTTPATKFAVVLPDAANGLDTTLSVFDGERAAFSAFNVPATPFAVVISKNGRIVDTALVGGVGTLAQLVETASVTEGEIRP